MPLKKHGHSFRGRHTREFDTWQNMRRRCMTPTHQLYKYYGGRGITICDRWSEFTAFLADMGTAPDGMSLERIDNNKGYSPENCRWASRKEQARNRRSNVYWEINGEVKCQSDWCDHFGVDRGTFCSRVKAGKSPEEALGITGASVRRAQGLA